MSRLIHIIGEINEDAFSLFSRKLAKLESASFDPVDVILCSGGGIATDALAFYDRIRHSPCHINIYAYGCIYSAATLVFAAGDHRAIGSSAWFMLHDDSGKLKGTTDVLVVDANQHEEQEHQWAELLAERSELPPDQWRRMSRKTTYLNPKQLLQYGLADAILKGKPRA